MTASARSRVPTALTIAGSDSGGGAGIQADLKTFAAFGVYGTSAITAVTAQNTVGVVAFDAVAVELVTLQIEAVAGDIDVHATKTGMLANAAVVEAVAATIRELDLPLVVVDPVMLAKSGDALLDEVYGGWSKRLGGQIDSTLVRVPKTGVCHERYERGAHFVRLSNTKVNGALCLIDLSGSMRGSPLAGRGFELHNDRVDIREITLDGVEADTLVFRWPQWSQAQLRTNEKSAVDTLWRAVNVKTRHLVIDMGGGPGNYFVDEIDFQTLSLINSNVASVDRIFEADQDDTKTCSLWLSEDASRRPLDDVINDPANLARIVKAFRYNAAESAQPFSRFLERLEGSAAASTEIKVAFRDFRRDKLCRTSGYFRQQHDNEIAGVRGAFASLAAPQPGKPGLPSLAESMALGRDAVCFGFLGAYTTFVVQEVIRGYAPGMFDYSLAIAIPLIHLLFMAFGTTPGNLVTVLVTTVIRGPVIVFMALWFARLSEHERALQSEVQMLRGLLPICSFCKSIRNEAGEWERLERFISGRSETKFSHGVCPSCQAIHYP